LPNNFDFSDLHLNEISFIQMFGELEFEMPVLTSLLAITYFLNDHTTVVLGYIVTFTKVLTTCVS
jgi:hypothetical protein